MKQGLRSGHVQPRVVTQKMVAQLDAELGRLPRAEPVLPTDQVHARRLLRRGQGRLTKAYRQAIVARLHPAMKRVRTFMAGDYLAAGRRSVPASRACPAARPTTARCSSNGPRRSSRPGDPRTGPGRGSAHSQGDGRRALQGGFTGDYAAFVRRLQDDPRSQYASEAALLEGLRQGPGRSRCQVAAVLRHVAARRSSDGPLQASSRPPPVVRPTPWGHPTARAPACSSSTPRTCPREPRRGPRRSSCTKARPATTCRHRSRVKTNRLPALLRFGWNPGFGEGWRCRRVARPGDGPLRRSLSVLRAPGHGDAARRTHGGRHGPARQGMGTRAGHRLHAGQHHARSQARWNRRSTATSCGPGQAPSYKVGELTIRKLRTRAEAALGPAFDVRRFHAAVLDTGALPLHVLDAKVDAWIALEQQRISGPS